MDSLAAPTNDPLVTYMYSWLRPVDEERCADLQGPTPPLLPPALGVRNHAFAREIRTTLLYLGSPGRCNGLILSCPSMQSKDATYTALWSHASFRILTFAIPLDGTKSCTMTHRILHSHLRKIFRIFPERGIGLGCMADFNYPFIISLRLEKNQFHIRICYFADSEVSKIRHQKNYVPCCYLSDTFIG